MPLPNISQYAASVAHPEGLTRTLGDFRAERNIYGEVNIRAGNNAAVFRIDHGGADRMLKCYTRPRPDLKHTYEYISRTRDPLFPAVEYLTEELYVFDVLDQGRFCDVVVGEWVDGRTLDTEIRLACREGDRARLAVLSHDFDLLARELLGREWAHGDLKPENIIVTADERMRLVDLDALYYPGNPNAIIPEVGSPGYQHPLRDGECYCKAVDDYPVALISVSLKALSIDPSLYGEFNRSDIIILNPPEIVSGTSTAYGRVREVLAGSGCFRHYKLALMLAGKRVELAGLGRVMERLDRPLANLENCEVYIEDGLMGYRDHGGPAIDAVFNEALPFRGVAALVAVEDKKYLLSAADGLYLFPQLDYDDLKPLCEGYAAFAVDGKWGYVGEDGTVIAAPQYDGAFGFHEGLAPVSLGGKWGYIDTAGICVTGLVFDEAYGVSGGKVMVCVDGKIMEIDREKILKRRE